MTNQQDNQTHIPIVLQEALATERTIVTATGPLPAIPEADPQTSSAAQAPARPEEVAAQATPLANAFAQCPETAPPGIIELLASLVSKVNTLAQSTNARFEALTAQGPRIQRATNEFSPGVQRNLFGEPSQPTRTVGHEILPPMNISPLGLPYGTRDPTIVYGTPPFAHPTAAMNFVGPSGYQQDDQNHYPR
ncbi:unnamed protein product [Cochlearia groenlandica]